MLTQPVVELLTTLLAELGNIVGGTALFIASLGVIALPWPLAWLDPAPFLFALAVIASAASTAAVIKGVRWLYGLVPVIQ